MLETQRGGLLVKLLAQSCYGSQVGPRLIRVLSLDWQKEVRHLGLRKTGMLWQIGQQANPHWLEGIAS